MDGGDKNQSRRHLNIFFRLLTPLSLVMGIIFLIAGATIAASVPLPGNVEMESAIGLDGLELAPYRMGTVGEPTTDSLDPDRYLTEVMEGELSQDSDGRIVRTFNIIAINKEIEIAPGVFFPAWTFNDHVPGPTLRATEGEWIRINFENFGDRPHSMHFHGYHTAEMDGAHLNQMVPPGGTFVYEFEADPVGVHMYHCHATPISQHIHNGLYGIWIVDPIESRPPAREMYMVMNGFDTNYDEENEIYAVNSVAFHYAKNPIEVQKDELVRIYLINILEFDMINSFHVHANFFDYYPTGTQMTPRDFTDTIILGQGERGIIEIRFPYTGKYMFHAHKTEFAERGWMGLFEVVEPGDSND